MAFNITITKKGKIDWHDLNDRCSKLNREFATVFPIQENGILNESGIGISINMKDDYSDFWEEFEKTLAYFHSQNFQIVELYNGSIIRENNIGKLKEMLK